jgi:hypothetical protein
VARDSGCSCVVEASRKHPAKDTPDAPRRDLRCGTYDWLTSPARRQAHHSFSSSSLSTKKSFDSFRTACDEERSPRPHLTATPPGSVALQFDHNLLLLSVLLIENLPLVTMLSSALTSSARSSSRIAAATSRRVLTRGFAKEIKFGVEGRAAMLRGVDTLADAVQVRFDSSLPVF